MSPELMEQLEKLFFSGKGIQPKYSNMHLLMPTVTIAVLVLLAIIILVQRAIRCKKTGTPFIHIKGYHFFEKGFNPFVFFVTIGLMVVYFYLLPVLHFVAASIIILFLLNILYTPPFVVEDKKIKGVNWKSLVVSVVISVVAPVLIYLIFGVAFGLTLP